MRHYQMIPRAHTSVNTANSATKSRPQKKRVSFQEELPLYNSATKGMRKSRSSSKRRNKQEVLRTPLAPVKEHRPMTLSTNNYDHDNHKCAKHVWDSLPCSPTNADKPQRQLSKNRESIRELAERVQRELEIGL